ncbi:acetyltransferase [Alicyclobacillus cellulosilyticus]|uniref:Acetyltransferase n=1 Tax=Alicyclobacillus cellulosilyticus TaxID=1003997 RepID=A0A917K6V6_9BACL|nr:N-acetyltransferase [Alicyclobacillus cellulosilyticus]GGJ03226.1 acetyltransferase [Alicyclobacillus cellulosilyticus]
MLVRKACIRDVEEMHQLIQMYAEQGLLLPRTVQSLCEHLQCFFVAELDGRIVGTAGLHILWKDLAEIRSLAVHPDVQGQGIGRQLVERLIEEAAALGVPQVLSLTYQTAFFAKLGFQVVQKETLPHKIWKDCIHCRKFAHCDEVAMIYYTTAPVPVHA